MRCPGPGRSGAWESAGCPCARTWSTDLRRRAARGRRSEDCARLPAAARRWPSGRTCRRRPRAHPGHPRAAAPSSRPGSAAARARAGRTPSILQGTYDRDSMVELSCYYSLSSPWAYLGGPKLQDIVRRHRVKLVLKPFDFQEVVPRTGGVPLRTRPEPRRTYHALELDRWRKYLGMPLNLEPKYYPKDGNPPGWNKPPGWMVIAVQERGLDAMLLSHALLRALWAEERNTADPKVRLLIAQENGLPGKDLLQEETSPKVQGLYKTYSEEAEQLGVFGAPTFLLNGERFWGQDRFDFLDRALAELKVI